MLWHTLLKWGRVACNKKCFWSSLEATVDPHSVFDVLPFKSTFLFPKTPEKRGGAKPGQNRNGNEERCLSVGVHRRTWKKRAAPGEEKEKRRNHWTG